MLLVVYVHSISRNAVIVCREDDRRKVQKRSKGNEGTEACRDAKYVLMILLFIMY